MSAFANNDGVTRHIAFTPEEDKQIRMMAEKAGVSITAYIRMKALEENVQIIDWRVIRQHTEALEYIASIIEVYTHDPSHNPWLFETDLELIGEELQKIKEMESKLIQLLTGDTDG